MHCRPVSAKFAVNSSSRFPFRALTRKQTYKVADAIDDDVPWAWLKVLMSAIDTHTHTDTSQRTVAKSCIHDWKFVMEISFAVICHQYTEA